MTHVTENLESAAYRRNRLLSRSFTMALLTCSAVLAGCSHLFAKKTAANPCAGLDWYEIGRADGAVGLSLGKLADHQQRCRPQVKATGDELEFTGVNVEQYSNGRNAGLIEFCTPTGGFEAGKRGAVYENVCPDYLAKSFMPKYELGRKIHDLEIKATDLQERIDDMTQLMSGLSQSDSMKAQIEQLEKRKKQQLDDMSRLESQAEQEKREPNSAI